MSAWPGTRWGRQLKQTESSLVHRLSNHRNFNTTNNSHDLANKQTLKLHTTKKKDEKTKKTSSHITN